MISKVVSLAAIAAGVVAMAMPAGAATKAPHLNASFAGGRAELVLHNNSSWGRVTASGLAPGDYLYAVEAQFGDGGSYGTSICTFHVNKGQKKPATCQHSGPNVLAGNEGTVTSLSMSLYKLENNTGDLVREATFS